MYKLYFMQGACSLATQVVLRELDQNVEIIDKNSMSDFKAINPVGAVPVLVDGELVIREGVAILMHLLSKHKNNMLPASGAERVAATEDMLFANATMHPAYGRLFFLAGTLEDGDAKNQAFASAATMISDLWAVVESKLQDRKFLGGGSPSAADILLAVYSTWGAHFPVEINIGEKSQKMIDAVTAMPSFKASVAEEAARASAA